MWIPWFTSMTSHMKFAHENCVTSSQHGKPPLKQTPNRHQADGSQCGRRRVRLCLPRRRSTLVARWVECWMADSGNCSDVGSNPSDGSCDIWCQKSLRRLRTDCTALFLLGISEWTPIAGQGGPKSWAKADNDREPRRATIKGQGGPSMRGVRVKASQDRGSRRATIGCLGGQRWRAKAVRDHSEIKKRGNSVVGAESDSVCLAAGVLLWRGGLSAGRLTQAIAATWVQIPATAPATFQLFR